MKKWTMEYSRTLFQQFLVPSPESCNKAPGVCNILFVFSLVTHLSGNLDTSQATDREHNYKAHESTLCSRFGRFFIHLNLTFF